MTLQFMVHITPWNREKHFLGKQRLLAGLDECLHQLKKLRGSSDWLTRSFTVERPFRKTYMGTAQLEFVRRKSQRQLGEHCSRVILNHFPSIKLTFTRNIKSDSDSQTIFEGFFPPGQAALHCWWRLLQLCAQPIRKTADISMGFFLRFQYCCFYAWKKKRMINQWKCKRSGLCSKNMKETPVFKYTG